MHYFLKIFIMLIRNNLHKYALQIMQRRQLAIFAVKRTLVHGNNYTNNNSDKSEDEQNLLVDKYLLPDILFSEQNQQRTINCMQQQKSSLVRPIIPQENPKQSLAAILICLCMNEKNEVSILYTRRSGLLTRHTRQISFPGGIKDPEDADFIECALRETEEEIGLSRKRIRVWGTGKLITPQYTAAIMPVIASVNGGGAFNINELSLNKHEVDEAFIVTIKALINPNALRHTQFKSGWSSPNFAVDRYKIWGLTGFITNAFLQCLIPMDLKALKQHIKYVRPYKLR